MYLPLPPSLTNVGSGLLAGNPHIWAVFYAEWIVLVFARWFTDAFYRGVLWRVPPRVRDGISHLGFAPLLQVTPFLASSIEYLFRLHYRVDWSQEPQRIAGIFPTTGGKHEIWNWSVVRFNLLGLPGSGPGVPQCQLSQGHRPRPTTTRSSSPT
jgi:hypothetical protein